ncbi:type II secretion system protein N [Sphingomonas cavernae]|uniref:Type II secretion system protein N n=1 Tax=Sphingomonas cavernae TaxID=2320861 RepID=A0A418WNX1_9SPHN|nr:type II secretion system protein N [Sphingomonas cavernae]RJF92931.1 type II secretion system protein N [Sphingomonas cavernae]
MKRIRMPLGRGLYFLCAFLIALIALLPLRLALDWFTLDEQGLSARKAEGSVWLGRLTEARFGDAPLGDLGARLSPIQLLVGRARVDLEGTDESAPPMKGAFGVSRNTIGIDDMTAAIPVAAVFAPLPVDTLDLSDVSVRFKDGQCDHAEGRVRATVAGDIAGINLGQGLGGNARCDGGALLLPLQGQSGMERLAIKLFEDGRYEFDLAVRTADPALGPKLLLSGFRQTQDGYVFSLQGRF